MSRRSNQEWVEDLRDKRGLVQEQAHKDLANYLYKVASNYLMRRQEQANPLILTTFTLERLDRLAEEFVQDTLEKIVAHNFALLDQYQNKGAFTSWMAVIVTHLIAGKLRRAAWNRRAPPPTSKKGWKDDGEETPSFFERQAVYPVGVEEQELSPAVLNCLDKLSQNRRTAIWNRVVKEQSVEEVAEQMNKSKNAVYSLVSQAKRDLQECLKGSDFGPLR